ncbi:hypothetical protein HDU87_007041 [Geranomyces variabilis]|uniref:Uncharacterized protein n=1 Tax=Geranomyces variabilis TaxID=109894 RepID=A0AAD5TEM0_9FUNG|nr:hypothetical protein HDU87_007041 [Geranomyces variabilis]
MSGPPDHPTTKACDLCHQHQVDFRVAVTDAGRNWFKDAHTVVKYLPNFRVPDNVTVNCHHTRTFERVNAPMLTRITDPSTIIYGQKSDNTTTPVVAIFGKQYGLSQYEQTTLIQHFRDWTHVQNGAIRPPVPAPDNKIPRALRTLTCDPDDNIFTTYAVNFNAVVDCHNDTQDHGWVWEYVVGDYDLTHCLCFPSLGLKVQCPSGTIIGHKTGLVEHYAEDYGSTDDPQDRYLHTFHFAKQTLTQIQQHSDVLDLINPAPKPAEEGRPSYGPVQRPLS